jgi:hypothetical protein
MAALPHILTSTPTLSHRSTTEVRRDIKRTSGNRTERSTKQETSVGKLIVGVSEGMEGELGLENALLVIAGPGLSAASSVGRFYNGALEQVFM